MGNTKLKLLRVLELIKETDEKNPMTASKIVERLKSYGIIAERKSICRDINTLIDSGIDIQLCEDNKLGYYMASREFEDWEVKILIDAVWSAQFLTLRDATQLTDKLKNMTSIPSQKLLAAVTPVKSTMKSQNYATKISIDLLLKAIKEKKKIKFQYTYTDVHLKTKLRSEGNYYLVNPYALIWKNERYYLICNYDQYDNLSFYRLDRIENLVITDDQIKASKEILGDNADIKMEEFVKTSIYHYGGNTIRLTISCGDSMIDEITDYFGNDIFIKKMSDELEVTVKVQDGEGLIYWLMQHGKHVKVISPESVKERLVNLLKETLGQYG